MTIRINPCGENIKPDKLSKLLGGGKQFPKRKYDKEGDKNTLSESRRTKSSGSRRHGTLPVKSTFPSIRYQPGRANQALRRRQRGLPEVSKTSSDANAPRRTIRSNKMRWRKTPQQNKWTRPGDGTHPFKKIHTVWWMPPTSQVG